MPSDVSSESDIPSPEAFAIPTIEDLDAMRVAHGLSQKELSRRAGCEPGRFHHILRNDVDPQTETMRAFLAVLQNTAPQTDGELASKCGPKPESSTLAEGAALTWDDVSSEGGD